AAGWLGKIKTAATMVSEVYILVVLSFDIAAPTYIFDTLIYICVFFTVLSGVEYFTKYGSYLNDNNSKT
ncbi:MAG: hypothetical protein LBN42_00450, partial [Oscillospiraceae bacterium]|nr:hypothetical protein [Oscillospiraceae bacterium]